MSRWPAVRTPTSAEVGAPWWVHMLATAAAVVGCTFTGVALAFVGVFLGEEGSVGGALYFVGLILSYAFLYSWLGFVPGVPLAVLALRKGKAGWAVALGGGAVSGGIVGILLGVALPSALIGALMAGVYWLALRLLASSAFMAESA